MGGDRIYSAISATAFEQGFPHELVKPTLFSEDENDSVINGESLGDLAEYSLTERQRLKAYAEVLRSYEELRHRSERLEEARNVILSYTPGSWIEKVAGMDMSDYAVPKTTTLLLVGPKGAGKSSIVNRISRVLEYDEFAPDRAQVSFDTSTGDGTYFLHEYLIPRGSGSFCLYDTRSLSDDPLENEKMIECWMTKGVHHGDLVERESDCSSLKDQLKCKAQKSGCNPTHVRKINFFIFVVNGLSVLESMDGDDDTKKSYTDMIATTFNNPLLSFKDDKPVVVVTHGDLLSLCDRARVRVHLGKLLGVPPRRQIFDIPESNDSAVALTIVDMLRYSLEHADRNLPGKDQCTNKVFKGVLKVYLFMLLMSMAILYLHGCNFHFHSHSHSSEIHLDATSGSIPNKVKDNGGACFPSQFEEATGATPNKRNESGRVNIQPTPSEIHIKKPEKVDFQVPSLKEIHLDEATGSTPNERKESRGSDFHGPPSEIHFDEATGSIHSKRKETVHNKRTEGNDANEATVYISNKMKETRPKIYLDKATGSRPKKIKQPIYDKRKGARVADPQRHSLEMHLDWHAIRHVW